MQAEAKDHDMKLEESEQLAAGESDYRHCRCLLLGAAVSSLKPGLERRDASGAAAAAAFSCVLLAETATPVS